MAVSWNVVKVTPGDLQKKLEELTTGKLRYRVMEVCTTPGEDSFTVVSYRLTPDKRTDSVSE